MSEAGSSPPSSIEGLVQQLLETDLIVTVKDKDSKDFLFSNSLSILKLANCVCKMPHLFTDSAKIMIEEQHLDSSTP